MRTMNERSGFTVVELIVVVVIIALLSVITLIAYNGVQRNAADSGLQSDLRNGAARIAADKSEGSGVTYPQSLAEANDGRGLVASSGSMFQYSVLPMTGDFCLTISHNQFDDLVYHYLSETGQTYEGYCSSHSNALVTTYAGDPDAWDFADGTLENAMFSGPEDLVVASNGDIYVSDTWNYAIRKISNGQVTTVAGAGQQTGDVIGPALDARFGFLEYIALSPDETKLYIVDAGNRKLKVLDLTTDTVSTLAGSGTAGYVDGPGASAQFRQPRGVATAADGTIYLTDIGQYGSIAPTLRKISPTTGYVETLAGGVAEGYANGTGGDVQFDGPWGLTVAPNGNIYIADLGNHCIRQVTPTGTASAYAGNCGASSPNYSEGTEAEAHMYWPEDVVAAPDGTLYVADSDGYRVRKVTTARAVTTVAGSGESHPYTAEAVGANANLPYFHGIAIAPNGDLYIAVSGDGTIRRIELRE